MFTIPPPTRSGVMDSGFERMNYKCSNAEGGFIQKLD